MSIANLEQVLVILMGLTMVRKNCERKRPQTSMIDLI